MDRINSIINNKDYKIYLKRNIEWERKRIFCHHDMQHFLDVARIAYIMTLEKKLNIKKDIIYGIALLHDIGRWKEYKEGIPHEIASKELALDILKDCNYKKEEINIIISAIANHRNKNNEKNSLNEIIYISDKLSRNCLNCKAVKECNWSKEKKNLIIKY